MSEINYSKKQINPLIEKYHINPETNEEFRHIIQLFDGQTNYQIWAIKVVFDNVAPLSTIEHIKEFADENQTLIAKLSKQNLVSYKTKEDFAQLNKEMSGALNIVLIKRCIEQFNTKQRDMLKKYVGLTDVTPLHAATNSEFKKHIEFFKKFDSLNESRKHKLIVTASAINDISFLIKHINDSYAASYVWEKEDLLSFIERNENCHGVKVVFNNGPIVVLEIPNFEASKTICGNGRTAWCLTRESNYFSNYAGKPGNRQFFYFDFSKEEKNEIAHVGFTVNKERGITYAHSTNNNSMMGDGIRVSGRSMNIHSLLKAANIDNKVFIHLNGLTGFKWTLDDVVKFINKNSNEIAICMNDNGRIVVKILTQRAFEKLCGNTLVNPSNLPFDPSGATSAIYVLLDLNLDANADNCMVTMQYSKDAYGSLSLHAMFDAYNTNITSQNYLNKIGIPTSAFLNRENIKPSILLHKYLDEGSEKDVLKLLEENSDELDVNFEFNQRVPIFTAVSNQLHKAFGAIVSNPKFDSNTTDPFGEPLLQSLMYDFRQAVASGKQASSVPSKKMIETILSIESYDLNAKNLNEDTAINVAAERASTNWILDILVQNPNVDINIPNDINCTPFENAIRTKNMYAIEAIGKRPDLKVRAEAYELAKSAKIDIDKYIKPTPFAAIVTTKVVTIDTATPSVDASEYAKIFASTFAKTK